MTESNAKTAGQRPHAPSVGLADLYFVFFRRKWLILTLTLLGIAGAVGFRLLKPPLYISEARLLVRFVIEKTTFGTSPVSASEMRSPETRGDTVMNSEVDVLTSQDVAEAAAASIGPEKILARLGGGSNRIAAAAAILDGLKVDSPRKSSTLYVRYAHPDPAVAVIVLQRVIEAYLKKHVEIHRPLATFEDWLNQQADLLRNKLATTEEELKNMKIKHNVISVEDATRSVTDRMSRIANTLLDTETELSSSRALQGAGAVALPSNLLAAAAAAATTNLATNHLSLPESVVAQYRNLRRLLSEDQRKESDWLVKFTPESPNVTNLQNAIAANQKKVQAMEQEHPELAELGVGLAALSDTRAIMDPAARVASLVAKFKTLGEQFERVRSEATNMDNIASAIQQLQMRRDMEASNYIYMASSLEMARAEEALGAGRTANIPVAQQPSPPFRDAKKTAQICAGIAAGGLVAGLVLAFLLEMVFSQAIRRPKDIENYFSVPLFMSIPRLQLQAPPNGSNLKQLPMPEGMETPAQPNPEPSPVPPEIQPYVEALRDRLSVHLEKFKHKPKLVAVAGLSSGAGTSTVAAGLAAAMSETGDGKVLLVDMNVEEGAAHPFYRGQRAQSLAEVIDQTGGVEEGTPQNQNLYLATVSADGSKRSVLLPSRFANLVPKLVATDYDYIIFDMPPISTTSVTPRLARLMDTTLLVVEAERTQRELLREASALLQAHKADVAVILNKKRQYVPQRFLQEL